HTLQDKIQAVYSHIATEVEHRLLDGLQDRWDKALANNPATGLDTSWRHTP
ncbi:MAG: site-specific integrase, partial [Pseudonocardiales bacterium]|nr:site-specific integrase [Pseudonocardiales bacterium]